MANWSAGLQQPWGKPETKNQNTESVRFAIGTPSEFKLRCERNPGLSQTWAAICQRLRRKLGTLSSNFITTCGVGAVAVEKLKRESRFIKLSGKAAGRFLSPDVYRRNEPWTGLIDGDTSCPAVAANLGARETE